MFPLTSALCYSKIMRIRNFNLSSLALLTLLWPALAAGAPGGPALVDREDWTGTYFNGQKLGFNQASIRVEQNDVQINTRMFMRLKAGGVDQATSITQETHLTPDMKLKSFTLLQEIMGSRQNIKARVEGDKLIYTIKTSGYEKEKSMDLPPNTVPASTLWLNILHDGLEVGKEGSFPLLVESFQMVAPMKYAVLRKEKLKLGGKEWDAFVIREEYSGIKAFVWMTADGTVLQERSVQGFESRRETPEQARKLPERIMSVSNFITLSLVKSDRPIRNARKVKMLKLKLANLLGPQSIPRDHRQDVLAVEQKGEESYTSTLLIKREDFEPAKSVKFPIVYKEDPSLKDDTSQIQSKHAMIRALAHDIAGKETDPWKTALLINTWVYTNLEKVLVDAFTALDALQSRRGECQSHTNLYTAIARAAGIPTRVVNGLVYSKHFDGFVYHAWPEVYVGEWRALDPTLGQDEVDATHIKLSVGNTEGSMKLMEFIGRVNIEVLENEM